MSYSDLESRIADSMHARADRTIESGPLRTGAMARARVIRRRRVAGTSLAGLAVIATTAAAAALLAPAPTGGSGSLAAPGQPGTEQVAGQTSLPGSPGTAAAAEQPWEVGTDPAVLHFDLDLAAVAATTAEWVSGQGYEGVTASGAGGAPEVDVYIGPDGAALDAARPHPGPYAVMDDGEVVPLYDAAAPEPATVDGHPGTLQRVTVSDAGVLNNLLEVGQVSEIHGVRSDQDYTVWVLRWEPVAGLHAIAQSVDRDLAYEAAGALLLDRAQRCAVPLRLTATPIGASQWTECRSRLGVDETGQSTRWLMSSLTLTAPDGSNPISIYAEDSTQPGHPADTGQIELNRTVAGYPAWWSTDEPAGLYVPEFGQTENPQGNPASVFVSATEPIATAVIEYLAVAGERDQPQTWPARAIG